jgi:predicted DNA-binding protein
MALNKKYVVQKSFRIDANLENDLELLSNVLGRTQNDLVNYALELLMKDNKEWFANNMLVEQFIEYFEMGKEKNHYEDDILSIDIIINDDFTTTYTYQVKDKNYNGDKNYSSVYDDTDKEREYIKESLRGLCSELIMNSQDKIDRYCNTRLDYR